MPEAVFDIIGEFAAQGRFDIMITLSFIVASFLLILAVICLKQAKSIVWLAGLLTFLLTGCFCLQNPLNVKDWIKIEQQVRDSVEKDFPLPEQITIQSHIGDDLRYATEMSVAEVVAFYRDAYTQEGYTEQAGSEIEIDQAALSFKASGKKDVWLEAMQTRNNCQVHIRLKLVMP